MWTLIIAVAGLIIGLFSLGWNIGLHFLSRPKIKVTASVMRMVPAPAGLSDDSKVLVLEAVNLRPRSVTIVGFYGDFMEKEDGNDKFFVKGSCCELASLASTLPCKINEGEVARLMTLTDSISIRNIKYFFASDTTGKAWYSRERPLDNWLKRLQDTS